MDCIGETKYLGNCIVLKRVTHEYLRRIWIDCFCIVLLTRSSTPIDNQFANVLPNMPFSI